MLKPLYVKTAGSTFWSKILPSTKSTYKVEHVANAASRLMYMSEEERERERERCMCVLFVFH